MFDESEKTRYNNRMNKIWSVNVIELEYSERGWGQKIVETKEFFDYASAIKFAREFNARNTNESVPDWYMYAESRRFCVAEVAESDGFCCRRISS